MFRTSDVILIAVMLSAAALTYKTKHDAQAVMNRIDQLETQIQLEKDAVDVLRADWSLLTQPGRLKTLTEIYEEELALRPVEPIQIVEPAALGAIPFRQPPLMAGKEADGQPDGRDPTVTGGVAP